MKQILLTIQLYNNANRGKMPDTLEKLRSVDEPDRDGVSHFDEMLTNPLTGERPGYIYVKPANTVQEIKDAYRTPILFEAKDGKPDPNGARGFADWEVVRK